jgi:CheY-like chemotaxis protein
VPTVVIVDDNREFLASSSALLAEDGFTVLACVESGVDAVATVRELAPAVVLLDVQLPDIDGFEVSRRLAGLVPRPAVVLISSRDAASYGSALAGASVRGFLSKVDLSGAALRALV